jgi:hypothetical protein
MVIELSFPVVFWGLLGAIEACFEPSQLMSYQRGVVDDFDMRDRQDIYSNGMVQKILKKLDTGNTEDDGQNFRGDLCPYIFTSSRIIVHNRGPFLRGQRWTVD